MAKNGPKGGGRKGAVRGRSQFRTPNGNWAKRDKDSGRIIDQKKTPGPYKGVTKEK